MSNPNEILAEITSTFLGGGKRKPPRAKPHRCLGCGRVTRHIFCPATYESCRALFFARKDEQ